MPPTLDHWALACSYMTLDVLKTKEFREAWADWAKVRREMHKPLTDTTIRRQIRKLEKWGHDAALRSLAYSSDAGYQGLFEVAAEKSEQCTARPPETLDEQAAREIREAAAWWEGLSFQDWHGWEAWMVKLLKAEHPKNWQSYVDGWKESGEWIQQIYRSRGRRG